MTHPIYKVVSVEVVDRYVLRVRFDDDAEQTIDFSGVLHGELFSPLRDEGVFRQVKIDPEVETIVWPNGADFDPATLHDWPQYADELAAQAQKWDDKDPARIVAEDRAEYGAGEKTR